MVIMMMMMMMIMMMMVVVVMMKMITVVVVVVVMVMKMITVVVVVAMMISWWCSCWQLWRRRRWWWWGWWWWKYGKWNILTLWTAGEEDNLETIVTRHVCLFSRDPLPQGSQNRGKITIITVYVENFVFDARIHWKSYLYDLYNVWKQNNINKIKSWQHGAIHIFTY